MTFLEDALAFTSSLTTTFKRQAEAFSREQKDKNKAKRIYLNALAVQSVNFYCECMGIETDLEASESWNPITHSLLETADLVVKDKGYLECCLIQLGDEICYVPPFVEGRISCVVIAIDEEAYEATLLGVLPPKSYGEISLNNLQPLDNLIDILEPAPDLGQGVNRLMDWLKGVIDNQWKLSGTFSQGGVAFAGIHEEVKQLYSSCFDKSLERDTPTSMSDADALAYLIQSTDDEGIRRKAIDLLLTLDPQHSLFDAVREKDLSIYIKNYSIGLRIMFIPQVNNRYSVLVRVYATGSQRFLPEGLSLTVLDENGKEKITHTARTHDDWLDRPLIVDEGDCFGIRISLGESRITETFAV